jgi:PAS domain S-box-containing protein
VAILLSSIDGYVERASRRLCDLLGTTGEDLHGRFAVSLRHPDDALHALEQAESLLSGERSVVKAATRFRRGDGTWLPAIATTTLVRDPGGAARFRLTIVEPEGE